MDAITDRALFEKLSATRAVFCCEGAAKAPWGADGRYAVPPSPSSRLRSRMTVAGRRAGGGRVGVAAEGGGAGGIRTPDIRLAKAALSQLSYGPRIRPTACERPAGWADTTTRPLRAAVVGHPGFEPGTSVLSGLRSNQLS